MKAVGALLILLGVLLLAATFTNNVANATAALTLGPPYMKASGG